MVTMESIKEFNTRLGQHKANMQKLQLQIELQEKGIAEKLQALSQKIGAPVTVDNVEQYYQQYYQTLETQLTNGCDILDRIEGKTPAQTFTAPVQNVAPTVQQTVAPVQQTVAPVNQQPAPTMMGFEGLGTPLAPAQPVAPQVQQPVAPTQPMQAAQGNMVGGNMFAGNLIQQALSGNADMAGFVPFETPSQNTEAQPASNVGFSNGILGV